MAKINPRQQPLLLHTSGVNESFHDAPDSFQDYIHGMQNVIAAGRIDLNSVNRQQIIADNSPYEWHPNQPTQKGILLVHGIYDSPYTLCDIAKQLVAAGFLVRSILLPGHGTVPGDLLNTKAEAFTNAVHYGIENLAKEVKDVYLLGFSLGGTLVIEQALQNPKIKALVLISPALKTKRHGVNLYVDLYRIGSWFKNSLHWYQCTLQTSHVRYECFPYNGAHQACRLMKKVTQQLKQQTLPMPIFVAATAADESVDPFRIIKFFQQQKDQRNQLLLYSSQHLQFDDNRITIRNSAFPEKNILDFAHTGLLMAPDNPQYGEFGEFKDFQHYNYKLNKHPGEIFLGAITPKNLKKHVVQRLSYNPDFQFMAKAIVEFLLGV